MQQYNTTLALILLLAITTLILSNPAPLSPSGTNNFMHAPCMLAQTTWGCKTCATDGTRKGLVASVRPFMSFEFILTFEPLCTNAALKLRFLVPPLMFFTEAYASKAFSAKLAIIFFIGWVHDSLVWQEITIGFESFWTHITMILLIVMLRTIVMTQTW